MLTKQLKKFISEQITTSTSNYCVESNLYLDSNGSFTDFCCEKGKGKEKFLNLINCLYKYDKHTQSYVIIYGYEEDDGSIYSNDMIINTSISESDLWNIFNNHSKKIHSYISPSEIYIIPQAEISEELTGYYLLEDKEDSNQIIVTNIYPLIKKEKILIFYLGISNSLKIA